MLKNNKKLIQQNKSGFSLLELIIAIAISALLSIALYQAFEQTRKSVVGIDRVIESDEALLLFYDQLDKDISAIFVPKIIFDSDFAKASPDRQDKDKPDKDKQESGAKKINIEKIFLYQAKDSQLSFFTFITTHALSNYNKPSAQIARVTYSLIEEPAEAERHSPQQDAAAFGRELALHHRRREPDPAWLV